MVKKIIFVLIFLTLLFIISDILYRNAQVSSILLVVPNRYEGYITVIVDDEKFDLYYGQAWENENVLEFHIGNDKILKVKSIKPYLEWPNRKVMIGREWASPIVYYKAERNSKGDVFGDLLKMSKNKYRFWVGKRVNLPEAAKYNQAVPENIKGR